MSRPVAPAQARTRRAPSARWLLALLIAPLVAVLGACGEAGGGGGGPVDAGGESWPLHVETPGVLGYAALPVPPDQLAGFMEDQVGWRPAGLAGERPLLLLALDPAVLGGDMGFVFPVSSRDAFERSLLDSPAVDIVGERRFHIKLAPDHPLAAAQRAFMGMSEGGPDAGAILDAFTSRQQFVISLLLRFEGDWAVLVPSFEAGVVASRVLSEIPGLLRDTPESLVLTVDSERIVDTYYEQIEGIKAQVRSLLLGTQLGGFAGAMMNAARNRGVQQEAVGRLPVNGEFLWTLIGMLRLGDVHGLQLVTRDVDAFGLLSDIDGTLGAWMDGGEDGELPPGDVDLRLAFTDDSAWSGLLSALRPAPELPGARLALAADADAFADALASWSRPLAEFVHGEGPPAERALTELAELLRPWGGLVTLLEDREGRLALGLATRGDFDADGAAAWLDDVADAASWDGARPWSGAVGAPADGAGDGVLPSDIEWLRFDDVLLLTERNAREHDEVVQRVREGRDGWADPEGPALRVRLDDAAPAQGLRAEPGELVLQLRWGADDPPPR